MGLVMCVAAGLIAAPSAPAAFHIMKVREVFPGTTVVPTSAFVELQMPTSGQNLVNGHLIDIYSSAGVPAGYGLTSDVPNGDNQRTVLVGDTGVVGADIVIGGIGTALQAAVGGGAVCWREGLPPDCVSWGNFPFALPAPGAGTPVLPGGIPDGSSITRSITPGCATLLEDADDTNNSAVDFSQTAPSPRGNATPPTEKECDTDAPQTKIKKRPKNRSDDDSPTFKFKSDEPGSTFRCKLDKKKFKKCRSPKTYHGLDAGSHSFKVKSTDAAGNIDKTPAKDTFKVLAG